MLIPADKVKLSIQQINHSLIQVKSKELNLKDHTPAGYGKIMTKPRSDNFHLIKRYIEFFGGLAVGALIFGVVIGIIVFTIILVIKLFSKFLSLSRFFIIYLVKIARNDKNFPKNTHTIL
jgi:uncharacterized membrane protein YphA (DoxX/SURF4 family)